MNRRFFVYLRKQVVMIDNSTKKFIQEHKNHDVRSLALQARRYPDVDMHVAATQIEGWQTACIKNPAWAATDGIIYPPRISMEQCSSEATALYKASLAEGYSFTDLTGGFGIDCSYMARNFSKATYIERNSELCKIAKHNFALFGLQHIEVRNSNSEDILATIPQQDWIFADPARRDDIGRKVVALSDCEPDITRIEELLMQKTKRAMIKCSPMLDITAACKELHYVSEVHVLAVNNECKELLFILSDKEKKGVELHCINLQKEGRQQFCCLLKEEDNLPNYTADVKEYLYEPNVAIQKAGCHNSLAKYYNLEKLHPNSHLYTSERFIEKFPGRAFKVVGVSRFSKSDIKEMLGETKQANITIRNFPESVQTLRKRLKIAEGGDIYLFATTLADNSRVLIKCTK